MTIYDLYFIRKLIRGQEIFRKKIYDFLYECYNGKNDKEEFEYVWFSTTR